MRAGKGLAFALAALLSTTAYAQSGALPFGQPSRSQLNAVRALNRLPAPVRQRIDAQISGLTDQQRRELLLQLPGLSQLPLGEIDAILAVLAVSNPPAATVVRDQALVPFENSPDFGTAVETDPGQCRTRWAAQSYTAGVTGTLAKVAIWIAHHGTFALEVRNVVNGLPGSSVLGVANFTVALPPDDGSNLDRRLEIATPPIPQSAGSQYAWVVRALTVESWPYRSRPGVTGITVDGAYAGGRFVTSNNCTDGSLGNQWVGPPYDLYFETIVQPSPP